MGQNQSKDDFELQQFNLNKPYSQVKIEKLNGTKITLKEGAISREILKRFNSRLLNDLLSNQIETQSHELFIEDVPFHVGKECYFFKGFCVNQANNVIEDKVFKLAKYKEIPVENMFVAQKIAAFLASEFSKILISKNNKILVIHNFLITVVN